MKTTNIEIKLKRVVLTAVGVCLFLGNEKKVFMIYVDALMGEQIRFYLSQKTQSRPLTFDFIRYIFRGFDISIQTLVIYKAEDSTFFAKLVGKQSGPVQRVVELDIRPSDAILLSLTMQQPLYIDENLFQQIPDATELLNNFKQIEA